VDGRVITISLRPRAAAARFIAPQILRTEGHNIYI